MFKAVPRSKPGAHPNMGERRCHRPTRGGGRSFRSGARSVSWSTPTPPRPLEATTTAPPLFHPPTPTGRRATPARPGAPAVDALIRPTHRPGNDPSPTRHQTTVPPTDDPQDLGQSHQPPTPRKRHHRPPTADTRPAGRGSGSPTTPLPSPHTTAGRPVPARRGLH